MNQEQARNIVRQTLTQSFDKARFQKFVLELLNEFDESKAQSMAVPDAFAKDVRSCMRLGTYRSPDKELLDVLIVNTTEPWKLERTRSSLRNFVAHKLKRGDNEKDAALVAFVSPSEKQWRFSYVKMEYATVEKDSGKIGVETKLTPARRFSYIVGEGESCHTAQTRFLDLLQDTDKDPTLAQVEEAFSVEAVTKEFFKKYADLFGEIQKALEKLARKDPAIAKEFDKRNVRTADFAKKLMGQIVFLYFIQKKGWLGVEKGKDWGTGPHDFLPRLARGEYGDYENFFNDILEPLFYDTLATDRGHDAWCKRFNCRIPFLNGGLFEPLGDYDWRKTDIVLPNHLFTNNDRFDDFSTGTGLLDMFDRYNFTVNEAEPLEKEVAIDPEMLGKVFENLIEENLRKGLGSYYTPREIVHYMCQESLINYLDTALNAATETIGREKRKQAEFGDEKSEQALLTAPARNEIVPRSDIETFVHLGDQISHYEAVATRYAIKMPKNIEKNARAIDEKLADITICDPAVGSGAFPVGMMSEIVRARSALTPYFNDVRDRTPYHFKRHAIQDCLYGVDVDPGAIEIAKLRLWLSLVVDEEDVKQIKPLPNLFYKIVTGNSLLGVEKTLFNQKLFRRLEELKPRYFDEPNKERKDRYKQQIDETIHELTNGKEAFDFEIYFSEVFHRQGGFDVVIANPPYRGGREWKEEEGNFYDYFMQRYSVAEYQCDIYALFWEQGVRLATNRGVIAYITPNTWLNNQSTKKLRSFILEKTAVLSILDCSRENVFESVVVLPIVTVLRKAGINTDGVKILTPENGTFQLTNMIPQRVWQSDDLCIFNISLRHEDIAIRQKLETFSVPLEKQALVKFGIKLYETGKGSPPQKASDAKNHVFESETKLDKTYRKYLEGKDVNRFEIRWRNRWLKYGDNLAAPRDPSLFVGERLLFRRIVGDRLIGTFTDRDFVTSQLLQIVKPHNGSQAKALLAILNSALIAYYFKKKYNRQDKTFPEIRIYELSSLPVPKIVASNVARDITRLVDETLNAKQRGAETDTSALEREIDQLVYALYGLTPEEIQIVEESTTKSK